MADVVIDQVVLEAMLERMDVFASELAALREQVGGTARPGPATPPLPPRHEPAPDAPPPAASPSPAPSGIDRRRLLKYLGTATAGAGLVTAAGVLDAGSAAAANPGFGGYNDVGTLQTNLVTSGLGPALLITQNYATIADAALKGRNTSASATGPGIEGSTAGNGPGALGFSASGPGVRGTSTNANAVEGQVSGTTNGANAVYGTTSAAGNGVFGEVTSTTSSANALLGIHAGPGNSVFGYKAAGVAGDAVVGYARGGRGVFGISETAAALSGVSGSGPGLLAKSDSSNSIEGRIDAASGTNGFNAVFGTTSNTGNGVYGEITNATNTASAVLGVHNGTGNSVFGLKPLGVGGDAVVGYGRSGRGVHAISDTGIGVEAQGGQAPLLLVPAGSAGAPGSGSHVKGELFTDSNGALWSCVVDGTPGVWRKLAGPTAAGVLHVLAAPARVYDSRPFTAPAQGPKTPLAANTARTLDLTVNSSGVPAGATAAMVNVLLVNAAVANANFTLWANGVTRPSANTMVWGGNAQRFSTLAVTGLDSAAKVQVLASNPTDLVLDVVGYYR